MADYKVTIRETSETALTARERILLKDTTNAIKLDDIVSADEHKTIKPVKYAVLDVETSKAEFGTYQQFLIIDADGTKYVTGSPSFWSAFCDIWNDMDGSGEEYEIDVYKLKSKNYAGKYFLTCSII